MDDANVRSAETGGEGPALAALARLGEIGRSLNAAAPGDELDLQPLLRQVAAAACELAGARRAALYLYDPNRGTLAETPIARAGEPMAGRPPGEPLPEALAGRVPLVAGPIVAEEAPGRTAGCWPLLAGGEPLGVLCAWRPDGGAFAPLELAVLENLAGQAALAVRQDGERRAVQRDLARKEDELDRLRHAGLLISSRLRLEETLQAILQMALEVTGARYGIFRLVDRSGKNLEVRAIAGERLGRPATEPLAIAPTSIMGWVAWQRRPLRIPDLREEPWARLYYPFDRELAMRSELAVPLIGSGGRLEGVLNLESPVVDAFSPADSHLLQSLATQAIVAIQQAQLLDALQETTELLLAQPYPTVLKRLGELARELCAAPPGAGWRQVGDEVVWQGGEPESDWGQKVLAILSRYATLALRNTTRLEALRRAQEQQDLAEAFAALGDVSANVLHHLNNKVGSIPVRVEGIQDKCAGLVAASPYLAANLAEIEKSAAEAMQAVRESLSLLHPIQLEPVDVAACVAGALHTAQLPDAVQVETVGLIGLPPVLAGRQSLALVLVNLLGNAAEAMGGAGRVTIRGQAIGGDVELSVSDTGPGIPPELQERVFEFAYSGHRQGGGHKLGFGLWWVKTLATRLGGTITVESDGAAGSTFRLRLPRAAEQGTP